MGSMLSKRTDLEITIPDDIDLCFRFGATYAASRERVVNALFLCVTQSSTFQSLSTDAKRPVLNLWQGCRDLSMISDQRYKLVTEKQNLSQHATTHNDQKNAFLTMQDFDSCFHYNHVGSRYQCVWKVNQAFHQSQKAIDSTSLKQFRPQIEELFAINCRAASACEKLMSVQNLPLLIREAQLSRTSFKVDWIRKQIILL